MADIELSEDPTSTWGATAEYRDAWNARYGNVSPSASASKEAWFKFATDNGKSAEEAEAATRDALVAEYGAGVAFVAPAAKQITTPGQGDGTAAEGAGSGDQTATTGTATNNTGARA